MIIYIYFYINYNNRVILSIIFINNNSKWIARRTKFSVHHRYLININFYGWSGVQEVNEHER